MRYAQIRSLDISNGENVGVALFVQGCHLHCKNCFNSETWDFNGGKEWNTEIKEKFLELINRTYIKRVSILGGEPLAEENLDDVLDLVTEINKRYNNIQYIEQNNSKTYNILNKNTDEISLLFRKKTIWLYSGYTWNQIMYPVVTDDLNPRRDELLRKRKEIVKQCDVMIDGRYIDSQRDPALKWRGSKNQRVIDVKKTLQENKIILYCE